MHRPTAWRVTHWSHDTYCLGAYSTLLPGGGLEHRMALGECLGGRLVIAGEACNPRAPAMTHGAWDAGFTGRSNEEIALAARDVLQAWACAVETTH